ncbi:MAG TPA: helix-turn-helix transcriptional regulator [Thermoanaerobaculia bacterium]
MALLREQRGLSQAEFAARSGISISQLSKYENEKERMRLDTLARLLEVLDLGFDRFFRFVRTLGEAMRLRPEAEPVERRAVEAAFRDLRIAIDRLERVIGRLVEPATDSSAVAPDGGATGSCVQGVSDQDMPSAGLSSKAEVPSAAVPKGSGVA